MHLILCNSFVRWSTSVPILSLTSIFNHQLFQRSTSRNMKTLVLPFLGRFCLLPIEIRLLIWEDLFATIQSELPDDIDHSNDSDHNKHNASPLSILCTSRYLYDEISSHLYHNLSHGIVLNPEYILGEWMSVRIDSKAVKVDLLFQNIAEAERHFEYFPHHKTKTVVYIARPDQADPGQVVLMWLKTTALVELLIAAPSIQQVTVLPVGSWESNEPPVHWRRERNAFFEMGGLQETIKSQYKYHPDHDIAMLPFLRPRLWLDNPDAYMPALSDDEFNELHQRFISLFEQKGLELRFDKLFSLTKDSAVPQIERTLIETDIFLENSLDELPGRTAAYLRRDRYQHWFKDGQSWDSPYGTNLSERMMACPWLVMTMDPWLSRLNERYITLILTHHLVVLCSRESRREPLGSSVWLRWDSQLWSIIFPAGLPRLSMLRAYHRRLWREKEQFRIFHSYADWIARRHARQIGIEEPVCFLIPQLSLWSH